jgi:hypothetical protein
LHIWPREAPRARRMAIPLRRRTVRQARTP